MLRARIEGECSIWETPAGTLRITLPSPHVTCVRFRGHLTDDFVEPISAAAERSTLGTERAVGFQDWEGMTNYDMSARARLVTVALRHRAKTERVHFLVGTTIVRLGINVANLVVGNLVLHPERRSFEEALRLAVAADEARGRKQPAG